MGINPHQGTDAEQIGTNMRKLLDRIERLERRDYLTRKHPVTGDRDFVGTVISTPTGVPVFVASESGLESPYASGMVSLTGEPRGQATSTGDWEEVALVTFGSCISNAVELGWSTSSNPSDGAGGNDPGEVLWRARSFILEEGFGQRTYLNTFETGPFFTGFRSAQGILRWEHEVPLDISQIWGIEIEAKLDLTGAGTATEAEFTFKSPLVAHQRGLDLLPNTGLALWSVSSSI